MCVPNLMASIRIHPVDRWISVPNFMANHPTVSLKTIKVRLTKFIRTHCAGAINVCTKPCANPE